MHLAVVGTLLFIIIIVLVKFPQAVILKSTTAFALILVIGALYLKVYNVDRITYPYEKVKIKKAVLFGKLTELELSREYEIRFQLITDSILINDSVYKVKHNYLCRVRDKDRRKLDSLYNVISNGNIITVSGTISKGREMRNPFEFNYQKYIENKGITGLVTVYNSDDLKITKHKTDYFSQLMFNIRNNLDKVITSLHTSQTSALLKGLLIGDRSEISDDINTEFINSGVMHVLAISGQHVAYILIIFILLFGRFNLYVKSFFTCIGLLVFLLITGFSASVFRAVVMALVIIAGFIKNRTTNAYNAIAVSAIIILLIEPNDLFDPGFQLSYSAVLGMISFGRYFSERIRSLKLQNSFIRFLLMLILVSFAAQIGTLPFTLYYFGKISISGILANIVVVPVSGIIISIGVFTLAVSPVSFWFAKTFALVNDVLCYYTIQFVHILGRWKYSYIPVNQFTLRNLIVSIVFILMLLILYKKLSGRAAKIIFVVLITANMALYASLDRIDYLPENKLTVMMVDVGQGDSFLLKFPNGKTALIDAGDASEYFDNGSKTLLPLLDKLGIDKIDYGFISHMDLDHYGGFISLIKNDKVKHIYKPQLDTSSKTDNKFVDYLKLHNVELSYYNKPKIEIGNVTLYFLNRQNNFSLSGKNDMSCVIFMKYGSSSFLFTGDIEKKEETNLIKKYDMLLKADVLKIPHHGSKTSSSISFLKTVSPKIALISAGVNNQFHHPALITLQKLNYCNARVLRSDLLGGVIMNSDGKQIKFIWWKM